MTAPQKASPRPEPVCERHGCKHPESEHLAERLDPWRSCTLCVCRGLTGWAGQRGRREAGEP